MTQPVVKIYGIALLACLGACKDKRSEPSLPRSFMSSENGIVAGLTTGYDSNAGRFVGQECIRSQLSDIEEKTYENSLSALEFKENASADALLNFLSGGLQIAFPIYPGVQVGGNVSFAISNAKSSTSKTYVLNQRHLSQKSLKGHYETTPFFQDVQAQAKAMGLTGKDLNDYVRSRCGDEFVNKVDYGASATMVATIDFGSVEAYNKFAVGMSLALLGGIATINADTSIAKDALSKDIILSLSVKQIGGQPENIARIFPDGLPRCKMVEGEGWADECRQAISMMASYMLGVPHPDLAGVPGFPQQLAANPPNLVPLGYSTEPYNPYDPSGASLQLSQEDAQRQADQVNAALQEVFGALQASEEAIQSLSRFIENPNDDATYAAYFQEVSQQLSDTVKMQREFKKIMADCWADRRLCQADDIRSRLRDIRAAYQPDLNLINYSSAIVTTYDWCMRAGSVNASLSFVNPRINDDDLSAVRALYALTGVSWPQVSADQSKTDHDLVDSCNNLHEVVSTLKSIDLNVETFRYADVTSVRPFSYLPFLESLHMRSQAISSFPRFYGVPNLKSLDLSYTKVVSMYSDPLSFAKLPPSLQCLDVSYQSGGTPGKVVVPATAPVANDQVANFLVGQMRYPTVIMRGYSANQIPLDKNLETIYLNRLDLTGADLLKAAALRQTPLHVYVSQLLQGVGAGTYGKVTISLDDNTAHCPSFN